MVSRKNVRNYGRKTQVKPYEKGRQAFKTGRLGNPFVEDTKENREWEMGFNKAYFLNLERVKLHEQRNPKS
tara:strand:- start:3964 stop:4176 length:213 start_codon:yes stop_codon:yes gene_type:complete